MKQLVLILLTCSFVYSKSQVYTVGTQTLAWADPARSNRSVGIEFRYPGTNSVVAAGQFPFVIFAHGFQMDQVPYYPYADSLAKQGYIVGLLTTETSLSPSHANFAQDLIFAYNKLISESNSNTGSPFYQKVIPKGALGGHSMGGGSTVLSAQYSNPASCYFTFAAAVTNPSSVAAATSMIKPYLAFAGSRDCIAPLATHQKPMYDSCGSSCKFLINITDALHCQFGNGNFQCNFGEGFSGCASSPLSRTAQINKTLLFLVPFLNYYLKGDCTAWLLFENRWLANTDAQFRSCTNTVPVNPSITGNNYFCTGSSTTLSAHPPGFNYLWNDNSTGDSLSVTAGGNYSVTIGNGVCSLPPVSVSVSENFPPATPSAITARDTVCSGIANIAISVSNDTNVSGYNWTLPAVWSITSGSGTNAIEAISDVNGGTISVTAQNDCGVSLPVQKTITVIPSNLGTAGAITGDTLLCEGETVLYSIAPVIGADSYVWSYPSGWLVISGAENDSVTFLVSANTGAVNVQAQNSCGQGVPSVLNVTVVDTPDVIISVQGNQLVSATSGSSYQWYLNGVAINGEINSTITPVQSGNYSLLVISADGCTGVSAAYNFIYSTVNEPVGGECVVFPNPNTEGRWQVLLPGNLINRVLQVTDACGRIVFESEIKSEKAEVEVPQFAKGIYWMIVSSAGSLYHRKLLLW